MGERWRYCEGLMSGGLLVFHVRRADKSGLCNWCRKRIKEEPWRWRRTDAVAAQTRSPG